MQVCIRRQEHDFRKLQGTEHWKALIRQSPCITIRKRNLGDSMVDRLSHSDDLTFSIKRGMKLEQRRCSDAVNFPE
jgi:hypothetical protein